MKQKIKFLLATIMMLAGTMVSQAQTETLLITINSEGHGEEWGDEFMSGSRTFNNIATITFSAGVQNDDDSDGWYNSDWSDKILSVTPAAGYTITKVKFYNKSGSAFDETSPFEATLNAMNMYVNGSSYGRGGVTKIDVYGYVTPATVDVTGVTLAPTTATLTLGETGTVTLIPTVLPGDATDKSVTWSSSNEAVATVADGVVTAVAAGEATITVTATNGTADTSDDKTATCEVTVSYPTYNLTANEETGNLSGLNDYKGKTCTVTYARSFTAGKTSTVCLPFAYTKKEGDGSFYAFTNIEKVGSEYVATMTEPISTTLEANTPYLYLPNATGDVDFSGAYTIPATLMAGETTSNGWTFKGTFATIEWTTAPIGTYGFSAQNADGISQGEFVKVGDYVRISPMRCYLEYIGDDSQWAGVRGKNRVAAKLPETIKVRLIGADGTVTAIGSLSTTTGEMTMDGAWYSINGTRLNGTPATKGIYVNNGKKVVVK